MNDQNDAALNDQKKMEAVSLEVALGQLKQQIADMQKEGQQAENPVAESPDEESSTKTQAQTQEQLTLMFQQLDYLRNKELTVESRAYALNTTIVDKGQELLPLCEALIAELDKEKTSEEVDGFFEELKMGRTRIERILDADDPSGILVTEGQSMAFSPWPPKDKIDLTGIQRGDFVLVNSETNIVMRRLPQINESGFSGKVVAVPEGDIVVETNEDGEETKKTLRCVVDAGGEEQVLSVPDEVCVEKGDQVLYDKNRLFVTGHLSLAKTPATSMLYPAEDIAELNEDEVGAINPVYHDLMTRLTALTDHPEWWEKLKLCPVVSYMFSGPTGVGKSLTVRLAANQIQKRIADKVAEGENTSRLVELDASTIYSSYFGETENRIARFFDDLRELAKHPLKGKDGEEVRAPLLVLLDEADALLRSRGNDQGASGHLFDRPLSLMLSKMQSAASEIDTPMIFICCTNRPDLIDPAARRRFGMRGAVFGSLEPSGAEDILRRKLKSRGDMVDGGTEAAVEAVGDYVYGSNGEGAILKVSMHDRSHVVISRRDMLTGAMLEEAVNRSVDDCLKRSVDAQELAGINPSDMVTSLAEQYEAMQVAAKPQNVKDMFPHILTEKHHPATVEPIYPTGEAAGAGKDGSSPQPVPAAPVPAESVDVADAMKNALGS